MRSLVLIGIMAALVLPGNAADKVTVNQLDQMLAQHAAKPHQPKMKQNTASSDEIVDISDGDLLHQLDQDDELIPQIAGMELTERLSTLTMYRLVGKYNLGLHVQQALELLADRSALLKLPVSEQLSFPTPDAAAQQKMLNSSRAYLLRELSHLPNFMATQTTTRFDNSPSALKYYQAMNDGAGFHRVGNMQRQITFQDGKEITDVTRVAADAQRKDPGLESRGEFGTEAAVVLMDIEHGSIAFHHWEQSMTGPAAVFSYAVPRESSHYEVTDACRQHVSFHDTPGYHGEIALDPRSGSILRMTLEAESKTADPVSHIASVIEYGPVVLGNRRSICPLRSLTFMVEEANGCAHGNHKLEKPVTMINQTVFSNYHRFGSSTTMILNEADNGPVPQDGAHDKQSAAGEKNQTGPAVSGQTRRP